MFLFLIVKTMAIGITIIAVRITAMSVITIKDTPYTELDENAVSDTLSSSALGSCWLNVDGDGVEDSSLERSVAGGRVPV